MKICPGCKRYYADDTQVFCLEDGVQLDFVADPNATIQMPPARDTDPPATLVLPPDQLPAGSGSATWPAQPGAGAGAPSDQTRLAGGAGGQPPPTIPFGVAPTAAAIHPSGAPPAAPGAGQVHIPVYGAAGGAAVSPKKSSTALIATVVVLAVIVLGLGGVLGYMWLNSDSKTAGTGGSGSSPGGSTPNSNTTSNSGNTASNTGGSGNDNTGGSDNSNTTGGGGNANVPAGTDSAWLEGSFSGNGTQYDGGKWTFTYVNTDGTPKIEYPSVRCGGRWDAVKITATEATFNEVITHGQNCISNGKVVVIPMEDGALKCKWYYVGDIVGAEATLRRN